MSDAAPNTTPPIVPAPSQDPQAKSETTTTTKEDKGPTTITTISHDTRAPTPPPVVEEVKPPITQDPAPAPAPAPVKIAEDVKPTIVKDPVTAPPQPVKEVASDSIKVPADAPVDDHKATVVKEVFDLSLNLELRLLRNVKRGWTKLSLTIKLAFSRSRKKHPQ
jgi:hypothetical protein